jgi:hypothetical protein
MKSKINIFCIGLLLAVAAPTSFGATVEFGAILSGGAEVPSVATPGNGEALIVFDDETGNLAWLISFDDLLAPAAAAHIHAVAPGTADPAAANGGVAINLVPGTISGVGATSGIFAGAQSLDLVGDAGFIDQLFAGELYINIHSSAVPSGEIRGHILGASVSVVPLPMAAWMLLSGLSGLVVLGRQKQKLS